MAGAGGAIGTGGVTGTGGVVGSGGATTTGGTTGTAVSGVGGSGGGGGATTSGAGGAGTGGAATGGSGGTATTGAGGAGTGGTVGSGGQVGTGGVTQPPVDAGIDGAGQSVPRDATKVQLVSVTAAEVFRQPTAPFLLAATLGRGADGLFDVSAKVRVSVARCSGEACNLQVTTRLSREETTQVETWLAVIPGEACQDDPGPVCDFAVHYAVGIDGPPLKQTCCKLKEWGQNGNVTSLHSYLQALLVAQLSPLDAGSG